ncbi:SsgA family sporulation/cell division regulator [Kitasatospora sp. NBC_01266]|uniref:SsgA family sporulation/cell division regulator n=1 Tax=Kitasatospora sp. NBC_01266 TaxID=2903572 RepID=UPI002E37A886|nr:SsgA family sporulation/cell division regulator [Kitasatospora sp. NBC_01266]
MTPEDPSGVPPQRSGAATCALRLELRAVILPGLSVPVAARLRYVRAEPYAVYLDTHVDMHAPITWVFARELLATGLHQWAGLGDVSVHPGTDGEADTVYICLGYEDEGVVLRAPAHEVRDFLRQTECLVPLGLEGEHLDLDALARRLLGPSSPDPGTPDPGTPGP